MWLLITVLSLFVLLSVLVGVDEHIPSAYRQSCGHRSPEALRIFRATRWLWHWQHRWTCLKSEPRRKSPR